jgi:MEMO1 family protein
MFKSKDRTPDERPPAVAGRFYPGEPEILRVQVEEYLADAVPHESGTSVKAIIAPHAGYMYSGPIAGSAYAALASDCEVVKRVVLIGPAHFESFEGLALSSCASFATPLGPVPLDRGAEETLIKAKLAFIFDAAHEREHSLEVQLPFLQVILGEFSIVPILAGSASGEMVGRAIETLWGGPETRFVISSDLSHYMDSAMAREMDEKTARNIEALNSKAIESYSACGEVPIRGMIDAARAHRLGVKTIDLRNSGDSGGPSSQVVGYGAFAFSESKARPRESEVKRRD